MSFENWTFVDRESRKDPADTVSVIGGSISSLARDLDRLAKARNFPGIYVTMLKIAGDIRFMSQILDVPQAERHAQGLEKAFRDKWKSSS